MPLYPGHGLEGQYHSVVGHIILTRLVQHATLSKSGPIRACSYTRDNPWSLIVACQKSLFCL